MNVRNLGIAVSMIGGILIAFVWSTAEDASRMNATAGIAVATGTILLSIVTYFGIRSSQVQSREAQYATARPVLVPSGTIDPRRTMGRSLPRPGHQERWQRRRPERVWCHPSTSYTANRSPSSTVDAIHWPHCPGGSATGPIPPWRHDVHSRGSSRLCPNGCACRPRSRAGPPIAIQP